MIVSETIEIPDRKPTFSKSVCLKAHPNRNTIHVQKHTGSYDLLYASQQKATLQNWTSQTTAHPQRFKTNPIRHILWQLLSLGPAVILNTAQL